MLELVNVERSRAGLAPVALGDNVAAQVHAENELAGCYSSHWDSDGLKPYMRYSLAGGYQRSAENIVGFDYCTTESDNAPPITDINAKVSQAIKTWMGSVGHRDTILKPEYRKLNVGIAWDRYNFHAVQQFEGDYIDYDQLPTISNGVLRLSGTVKNGLSFRNKNDLFGLILHDPPPHALTRGQIARTYCYDYGRTVAALRPPPDHGSPYPDNAYTTPRTTSCPDPYDVPADAAGPTSKDEAVSFWQAAKEASVAQTVELLVPWVDADHWIATSAYGVAVDADLSGILAANGPGVYTVALWGKLNGEDVVFSVYSIFHEVDPPTTYAAEPL